MRKAAVVVRAARAGRLHAWADHLLDHLQTIYLLSLVGQYCIRHHVAREEAFTGPGLSEDEREAQARRQAVCLPASQSANQPGLLVFL